MCELTITAKMIIQGDIMSNQIPRRKRGIVYHEKEIRSKSQALNYCLLVCPNRHLGCAVDCKIRKKWHIPPHGTRFYDD